jgi:hypothetical protein
MFSHYNVFRVLLWWAVSISRSIIKEVLLRLSVLAGQRVVAALGKGLSRFVSVVCCHAALGVIRVLVVGYIIQVSQLVVGLSLLRLTHTSSSVRTSLPLRSFLLWSVIRSLLVASYFASTVDSAHQVVLIVILLRPLAWSTLTFLTNRCLNFLKLSLLGRSQKLSRALPLLLEISIGFTGRCICEILLIGCFSIGGRSHLLLLLVVRAESCITCELRLVLLLGDVLGRHQKYLRRVSIVGCGSSISLSHARLSAASTNKSSLVWGHKLHPIGLVETVGLLLEYQVCVFAALTTSPCHSRVKSILLGQSMRLS